jgi:hypothetical protein
MFDFVDINIVYLGEHVTLCQKTKAKKRASNTFAGNRGYSRAQVCRVCKRKKVWIVSTSAQRLWKRSLRSGEYGFKSSVRMRFRVAYRWIVSTELGSFIPRPHPVGKGTAGPDISLRTLGWNVSPLGNTYINPVCHRTPVCSLPI